MELKGGCGETERCMLFVDHYRLLSYEIILRTCKNKNCGWTLLLHYCPIDGSRILLLTAALDNHGSDIGNGKSCINFSAKMNDYFWLAPIPLGLPIGSRSRKLMCVHPAVSDKFHIHTINQHGAFSCQKIAQIRTNTKNTWPPCCARKWAWDCSLILGVVFWNFAGAMLLKANSLLNLGGISHGVVQNSKFQISNFLNFPPPIRWTLTISSNLQPSNGSHRPLSLLSLAGKSSQPAQTGWRLEWRRSRSCLTWSAGCPTKSVCVLLCVQPNNVAGMKILWTFSTAFPDASLKSPATKSQATGRWRPLMTKFLQPPPLLSCKALVVSRPVGPITNCQYGMSNRHNSKHLPSLIPPDQPKVPSKATDVHYLWRVHWRRKTLLSRQNEDAQEFKFVDRRKGPGLE